jgi:hypothetical protein
MMTDHLRMNQDTVAVAIGAYEHALRLGIDVNAVRASVEASFGPPR